MRTVYFFTLLIIIASCQSKTDENSTQQVVEYPNNPAEGFNLEASDEKAILIADEVMEAMGGRENWDKTRTICWNFFGYRELIWDKWTGDVRIKSFGDTTTYLLNINTMEGKVMKSGEEVTDEEELKQLVERGKRIWINDSYWLIMPFKLKDSGVTLTYVREDTTMSGVESDVLKLTFDQVGVTPQNMYEVWVSKADRMVKQWYYYPTDTSSEARYKNPWEGYEKYGEIYLSGDRGSNSLSNIMVLEEVPETVFTSFEEVDLTQYLKENS